MNVKRYFGDYDEGYGCNLIESPDGDLVLHSDYAALEARCAGLEREREIIAKSCQLLVGFANAGDDSTCRWCCGTNCAHTPECPINLLINISMIVMAKTQKDYDIARSSFAFWACGVSR